MYFCIGIRTLNKPFYKTMRIFYLLTIAILSSCTSNQQIDSDLPVIDLEKEYPVKRIDIHEIADVEYIPLETTDESVLMNGWEKSISDKYIILADTGNGTYRFLIFDRQGKYIRTIENKLLERR